MWNLGSQADGRHWTAIDGPTSVTLSDVVQTSRGPHAVGANGVLISRADRDWDVAFDDGPAAQSRDLQTAASTDGGERVWFAGSAGSLGFYGVTEGEKHDWSTPTGRSGTFDALAVAGEAGSEKLLLAGAGTVLPGYVDGCRPRWDDPVGIDSSGLVTALAADPEGYGYAATSQGRVYETTPEDEWRRLGIANTQETFPAIHVTEEAIFVGSVSGRLYRYNREQSTWTTIAAGDAAIRGFGGAGDDLIAVGDGGTVHSRVSPGSWRTERTPVRTDLLAAVVDPTAAVGRDGTLLVPEQ